ncbi:hypothetical protein R1sor_020333 [Riccia sorocarpa]|uniref:Prokaryotic-type class I peptide chain release factors domain-containing protein n=1 Tax=Riccia sorocarpa TaxID=122646 RepID=A0ABD3IJD2_9MARC
MALGAAGQMLSGKFLLITRPLSSIAPCCSPSRWIWGGLRSNTPRHEAATGQVHRTVFRENFCVRSGTHEPQLVASTTSEEYGNADEFFREQDLSKLQENANSTGNRVKGSVVLNECFAVSKNYLELTDKELFAQCKMDTYRASGPGGQHRNKTDSAVRLKHLPTGLVTQACEDRSQHKNRALALGRMRQLIALEVREKVELEGYKPPPELVRILPFEKGAKKDRSVQKIGPNHPDFSQGVKCLLDLLEAVGGSVSDGAAALGLTTGSLSKLITSDKNLWQGANKIRASKGLKPLR